MVGIWDFWLWLGEPLSAIVDGVGFDLIRSALTRDYLILVFLACFGVVQMASARSGRAKLLAMPSSSASRFGLAFIAAGYIWFFIAPLVVSGPWGGSPVAVHAEWGPASIETLSAVRVVNDTLGGLSANHQVLYVAVGVAGWGLSRVLSMLWGSRGPR
jgi:hypothetical protein